MTNNNYPTKTLKSGVGLLASLVTMTAHAYNEYSGPDSCLAQVVNGDSSTCYTMTASSVADQEPGAILIDGLINESIWEDAITKSIAEPVEASPGEFIERGQFKIYRSMLPGEDREVLYLSLQINGVEEADSMRGVNDKIEVLFDPAPNYPSAIDTSYRLEITRDGNVQVKSNDGASIQRWGREDNSISFRCRQSNTFCQSTNNGSQLALVNDDGSNNWSLELRLVNSDFGFNSGLPSFPQLLGFGLFITDSQPYSADFPDFPIPHYMTWPWHNMESTTVVGENYQDRSHWGLVKNRFPLDVKLVIDQSGSMNAPLVPDEFGFTRYDASVNAANHLIQFMSVLSDPNYFDDQIEVMGFTTRTQDGTSEFYINELLSKQSVASGELVALERPVDMSLTPIAFGLNEAFLRLGVLAEAGEEALPPVMVDKEEQPQTKKIVNIITDGLHNRMYQDFSLVTPAVAGEDYDIVFYDPCGTQAAYDVAVDGDKVTAFQRQWDTCAQSEVEVNTLFLGQDGVQSDGYNRMSRVAGHFGGAVENSPTPSSVTNDISEIRRHIVSGLKDVYQFNQIILKEDIINEGSGSEFDIDFDFDLVTGNAKLIALASWSDASQMPADASLSFNVNGEARACDAANINTSGGLSYCVIDFPSGGNYTLVDESHVENADELVVFIDLILDVKPDLARKKFLVGQTQSLAIDVNYAGLPLAASSNGLQGTLYVESPLVSAGSLAAKYTQSCDEITEVPDYVSPVYDQIVFLNALMYNCRRKDIEPLPREIKSYEFQIRNGRLVAQIDAPVAAGIANLRYLVSGRTPTGESWQREERFDVAIAPAIDPKNTEVEIEQLSENDDSITYRHFILPKDGNDQPIGHGLSSTELGINVPEASRVGELQVTSTGRYYRDVEIPKNPDEPNPEPPVVEVVIEGESTRLCRFEYISSFDFFGQYFTGMLRIKNPSEAPVTDWQVDLTFADEITIYNASGTDIAGVNPYTLKPNHFLTETILPGLWVDIVISGQAPSGFDLKKPKIMGDVCEMQQQP